MRFTVDAVPTQQFEQWAMAIRCPQTYAELAKPSEAVAAFTYRAIAPGLFNTIPMQVCAGHGCAAHLTHALRSEQ